MAEIKICGLTSLADARFVAENGADALGFIFYPKSPRKVTPGGVRDIVRALPAEVAKVGVFVNEGIQTVREVMEHCGLDFVQLHGNESPGYCRCFPESVIIKALFPRMDEDLNCLAEYRARAILVDTYDPKKPGGTGKTSKWELAVKIRQSRPLILSGGLNPCNIETAMKKVLPDAVDINSGVEETPGKKDRGLVMEIIDLIRRNYGAYDKEKIKIFDKTMGYDHRGKD